jgi:hypothetical protein
VKDEHFKAGCRREVERLMADAAARAAAVTAFVTSTFRK